MKKPFAVGLALLLSLWSVLVFAQMRGIDTTNPLLAIEQNRASVVQRIVRVVGENPDHDLAPAARAPT